MNLLEEFDKHIEVIASYKELIRMNNREAISNLYKYIKSITNLYYDNGKMRYEYVDIRDKLLYFISVERGRIIDVKCSIDLSKSMKIKDDFIKYLVWTSIKRFVPEPGNNSYPRFEQIHFTNHCKSASEHIKSICDKNGIENHILEIIPGYKPSTKLFNGTGYHYANIIYYNQKYYLVDVTYSQFFYSIRNSLDSIGIIKFPQANVGTFMLMSDYGTKVATELLTNGYTELTEEVFKAYMDAFTMSFRNGLYYERTGDFTYTTNYSIEDYINFIHGDDNQLVYEGRENLGYQLRPLRNPQMDLSKR